MKNTLHTSIDECLKYADYIVSQMSAARAWISGRAAELEKLCKNAKGENCHISLDWAVEDMPEFMIFNPADAKPLAKFFGKAKWKREMLRTKDGWNEFDWKTNVEISQSLTLHVHIFGAEKLRADVLEDFAD